MKTIELTKGYRALVDDDDYEFLNQWKWCVSLGGRGHKSVYAIRSSSAPYKHIVFMHRQLLNTPDGMYVDHVNRDTLDNRRSNLRLCTMADNARNKGIQSNNTSGYKGVKYEKRFNRWYGYACLQGKYKHLGSFGTPKAAALAYNQFARKYFGEFAVLNEV